jgi:hypothetical protein
MWVFRERGIKRRALAQVEGRPTRRIYSSGVPTVAAQAGKLSIAFSFREAIHFDTIAHSDRQPSVVDHGPTESDPLERTWNRPPRVASGGRRRCSLRRPP